MLLLKHNGVVHNLLHARWLVCVDRLNNLDLLNHHHLRLVLVIFVVNDWLVKVRFAVVVVVFGGVVDRVNHVVALVVDWRRREGREPKHPPAANLVQQLGAASGGACVVVVLACVRHQALLQPIQQTAGTGFHGKACTNMQVCVWQGGHRGSGHKDS